jgi:alkaline phosphatase D
VTLQMTRSGGGTSKRLAPEPLAFEQPLPEVVEAEWTLATDSGMRSRVACGVVATSNLLGHSVHVPFHGLRPGRTYYPFRASRG